MAKNTLRLSRESAARKTHEGFVDSMYSVFGLNKQPSYATISFVPMFSTGGVTEKGELYLDDGCLEEGFISDACFEYVVSEESAHVLHQMVVGFKRKEELLDRNYALGEIVCALAALIFLEKAKGDAKRYFRYVRDDDIGYKKVVPEIFDSLKSREAREGLVRRLSKLDMREAKPIILGILSRDKIYNEEELEETLT